MRSTALIAVLACVMVILAGPVPRAADPALRYGIAAFGNVDPLKDVDVIARAGYDYIEPALSKTVALPPQEIEAARARVQASGIRVETMNWFLPGGDLKLTGPTVDAARIREYVERSLALAESFGVKVIVFGSPAARSVPDGFPHERALAQLETFLTTCGEVIRERGYGMVIGIEPLRRPETNIINSVAEGLQLARRVNHPKVRLIVDFYHLAFEHEDPDVVLQAKDFIVHTQIAAPADRMFPVSAEGEPRYARFFANLAKIGYRGRVSIEANAGDLRADAPKALRFLKGFAGA